MNDRSQSAGLRVLQFSVTNLFVLMTVTALVLAIFFGVGRAMGMSTMEVLTEGLGRQNFHPMAISRCLPSSTRTATASLETRE